MNVLTHEDMLAVRVRAEEAFRRQFQGVLGVGIGARTRQGRRTDETVLSVVVGRKLRPDELAADQKIPDTFEGMPTDVLALQRVTDFAGPASCENHQQYDPLLGGITISTLKPHPAPGGPTVAVGTLGFFATIAGLDAPRNIALVTNAHVVGGSTGVGDTILQPAWATAADGTWIIVAPGGVNSRGPSPKEIGPVLAAPAPADDSNGFYVDAAAVQLDFCISSCCHSNCGIGFEPHQILGLNVGGADDVVDIAPSASVKKGDTVYKVGASTARTVGQVTQILYPVQSSTTGAIQHNVMEISPVSMSGSGNCGGTLRFADHGDSGAALVDAGGRLIGLIYGGDDTVGTGHACYIEPILAALKATAITKTHPVSDNPAASGATLPSPAFIGGRPNMTPQLRARVLATSAGRELWAAVERHRLEVQRLVNRNRRVAVAWHRHRGPQFLNRMIANARDPAQHLPRDIDGVARATLLRAMAASLSEHGSDALRADIARHSQLAEALVADADDLHGLVDRFNARELA